MPNLNKSSGFTLIELIIVVVIVAIFAVVAIPSYQSYVRRAIATQAQQEMQRLAVLLDKHKAKNFSYRGFDLETENLPANAAEDKVKYILQIRDGDDPDLTLSDDNASGHNWTIQAQSIDVNNYTFLLTSQGVRCKNMLATNVDFESCGTVGQEEW